MTWAEFMDNPEACSYDGPCVVCGCKLDWWHPAAPDEPGWADKPYRVALKSLGARCIDHYYGTMPGDSAVMPK